MLVMKFGGTSLEGADNIREAAGLVLESRGDDTRTAVVVSAMAGTTNRLLQAARAAAAGKSDEHRECLAELAERHLTALEALTRKEPERRALGESLDETFRNVGALLDSVGVLGELTPRALDRIAASGERLSARLTALAFREMGVPAEPVDASTGLILTNSSFGEAAPDTAATTNAVRSRLAPMLDKGIVPVVTGFIGSDANGETTTLGRSGSDYSAAVIGGALDADEVWIWSDVDGILTADPKIVSGARVLEHLSYVTASELASCGAEVLHPKTIRPLLHGKVPLRLKNTFNPEHPGTVISSRLSEHPPAIISSEGLSLLSIHADAGDWMPETTGAVLRRLARAGVNVLLFLQSAWQHGMSLVVRQADGEAAMMAATGDGLTASIRPGVATVSVIGHGVIMPTMAALGETGADMLAILQATADSSIIVVVPGEEMPLLVRHLHERITLNGNGRNNGNLSTQGSGS